MASKLCPHIQICSNTVLDAIRRVQPPMVKTMDLDRGRLEAVRQAAPETLIVARRHVDEQLWADYPVARGRKFAETYGDVLDLVDVVEVYNESVNNLTPVEQLPAFDVFQVAFARRIWELNERVQIGLFCLPQGNWSYPGEPNLHMFPKTLALPKDKVIMCFHEYSWYTWDWESPARCLRYRTQMHGLSGYRVAITECGLTQAVLADHPDVGWQSGVARWTFVDGAKWYDSELQQNDYVVGAAMFNCGPSYGWETFDCAAEWEEATHG